MVCPKCKSENIIEGELSSHYPIRFIKKGTQNKLLPTAYKTECKACLDCGEIFDMHIVTTGKNKVGKNDK